MKKIAAVVLAAIILLLCFTSCSPNTNKIKDGDAAVGIIAPKDSEEYEEALRIQEKYGAEKVTVETFDSGRANTTTYIYEAAERILENQNVKSIIFAKGVEGTVDAIKAIKAAKPSVECIDVNPGEVEYHVSMTADLAVSLGENETCASMVSQAKKAGMKTVVYLIPDKYIENKSIISVGEALKAACDDKKIEYVEHIYQTRINTIDYLQGVAKGAVVSCIEKYGEDTAFYTASCIISDTVIKTAAENGAGYIYNICNCPENHYKTAFGVEAGDSYSQMLDNVREAAGKDACKKLCVMESSPVSVMLKIAMGYAVAYCNGSINADAPFSEDVFKSAVKTALNGESIDDIEFSVSEEYANIVNVGFPVNTL